ncbi:NAD-dependent epimerase/dehydratase family protein [Thermaurantiacus sp.]
MAHTARLTLAITGGTGFVGSHLIDVALAGGHAVRALTRRQGPERAGVTWVPGDLSDQAALDRLVAGADAVIHVAGVTNARNRAGFDLGNVAGTAAMRRAAGALPFVHVSSLAARHPELSIYGASKRQAEDVARGIAGPVAMVRPPAVYGPRDTQILALFKAARLGLVPVPSGAVAAMIYAPDLAAALVALAVDLASAGKSAGGIFEIDDGHRGYPQAELVRAIGRALGTRATPIGVPGFVLKAGAALDTARARLTGQLPTLSFDRASYLAHPDWTTDSRALRALGIWAPSISLEEGLSRTAAWYRGEGWL